MRILAFDTSTEWCSIAATDGSQWFGHDERLGPANSERLLPLIDAVLAEAGWKLADLDGLAFGAGPGAFTGIRIACGVAQGLAWGADLPVVPVTTLAAIAQESFRTRGHRRVVSCLDARMREVYVAAYASENAGWREVAAPAVLPPAEVRRETFGKGDWAGAGGGFTAYPELAAQLELACVDVDARPTARAVAELARPRLVAGDAVTAVEAVPLYVRHRIALTSAEQEAGIRM